MRILYSVHRYGEEIVGGAETACRLFAEQLVARGHEVNVLTSCALSYRDWADHYPPGVENLNGVRVHRLPVTRTRDAERFAAVHSRLMTHVEDASFPEQFEWLSEMGPLLDGHSRHLRDLARTSDVAVFMTYLYPTTAFGIPVLAGRLPVVIQPTAHDEPPARAPFYRALFRNVDGALFLTDEERETARQLYGWDGPDAVTGIGINPAASKGEAARFRRLHGLGDDPYLLYVGRLDTFKGVSELMRYFVEFKGRNPSTLKLVLAGEKMMELPEVDDIRYVGFLDEQLKADAVAGSVALVQPSPYESFSIVLCEAWQQERPVLVQAFSSVMSGQCRRSGGGLPYDGFAEFEGCVRRFLDEPALGDELGRNGARYVDENYGWDSVMQRFTDGVHAAISNFVRG